MSKDEKTLPMTQAGLVRYYDSDSARIKITPENVVIFSIVIAGLVLLLKFML